LMGCEIESPRATSSIGGTSAVSEMCVKCALTGSLRGIIMACPFGGDMKRPARVPSQLSESCISVSMLMPLLRVRREWEYWR
jgi:hypothetical protein